MGEEETRGRNGGYERGYGRGAYGMRRGPYAAGSYGYEATSVSYAAPGAWDAPSSREYAGRYESRPTGPYSGRGPKGYTRSRERLVEGVCDRLTDHPELDASQIQVDAKEDVIVLRGSVHDRGQKRLAEDVAGSVSGVRDVRNELDVDKGMLEELTDAITGRSEEPSTSGRRARARTGA
jgi:osmotically-inducible protein OsmY